MVDSDDDRINVDTAANTAFSVFSSYMCINNKLSASTDFIAEEVPVALEYNGISHAVMLATPNDLEDFATGFSLSEGIIDNTQQIYDIVIGRNAKGITVKLQIAQRQFFKLKTQRRNLAGRTGCGLCGRESLEHVYRIPAAVQSSSHFASSTLYRAFKDMERKQVIQQHTGATHAAAWLNAQGQIDLLREDVGRHNALDKLIGAMAQQRTPITNGAILITSRASYEMVLKTATVGVSFLAAISGPTALAVRLAQQTGVTLVGFVRQQRLMAYSHPERLNNHMIEQQLAYEY